jgi:NADH-quinone oxidoreductase subunit A
MGQPESAPAAGESFFPLPALCRPLISNGGEPWRLVPSTVRSRVLFPTLRAFFHEVVRLSAGMDFSLSSYYPIFLYLVVIVGFAVSALAVAHLLGPSKATPVKQMPYESGMDPIGDARQRFDVRFYLVAILFLVFDVELLFLYPWSATYQEGSIIPAEFRELVFWEVLAFLASVAVAYVYAWRKGVFRWR